MEIHGWDTNRRGPVRKKNPTITLPANRVTLNSLDYPEEGVVQERTYGGVCVTAEVG